MMKNYASASRLFMKAKHCHNAVKSKNLANLHQASICLSEVYTYINYNYSKPSYNTTPQSHFLQSRLKMSIKNLIVYN